ncbi:MAG: hypothetical protein U0S48_03970 [Solirubrobacteraceae bacterium]
MVAVDEQEIDGAGAPSGRDVVAERHVPDHARTVVAGGAGDDAAARLLDGAPSAGQRGGVVAERVDEMQLLAGSHDLGERDGGAALVDADLDYAGGIAGQPLQQRALGSGVHGPRRDQADRDRDRAQARVVAQAVGGEAANGLGQRHRPAR